MSGLPCTFLIALNGTAEYNVSRKERIARLRGAKADEARLTVKHLFISTYCRLRNDYLCTNTKAPSRSTGRQRRPRRRINALVWPAFYQ